MKGPRGDAARLQDILDAIAAIQRHNVENRSAFDSNELLRFFMLKHIEILGEAIFKLSHELKTKYPEVPWSRIEKTRHVLVHDYFDVNWDIVWMIVQDHLPLLRSQIDSVIATEGLG